MSKFSLSKKSESRLAAISINFSDIDGSGPAVALANANYYMAAASATNGGAAYAKTSTVRSRNVAMLACIKY